MKTNQAGIDLIKHFEGVSLKRYICPGGYPTIGIGSRLSPSDTTLEITMAEAEERLRNDLKEAENAVNRLVKVKLNENQFSALVSFVFNLGYGNFSKSTLLKRLNDNELLSVPQELTRWINVNRRPMLGLARRRVAESELFLKH